MNVLPAEKFIETNLKDSEVYPITMVKFLLNRSKILSHFAKAATDDFELRGVKYKLDNTDCEQCKTRKDQGILCRQHTSIQRVLTAEVVAHDLDTQTYFTKNEVFRMIGNRLVIVYCPHTKLINGTLTDNKVRMINTITIEDPNISLQESKKKTFLSSHLLDRNVSCWFNNEFTLVTIPHDRTASNFMLRVNEQYHHNRERRNV